MSSPPLGPCRLAIGRSLGGDGGPFPGAEFAALPPNFEIGPYNLAGSGFETGVADGL